MINSETFYSAHTTVADSDTVYPVGFVYSTNSSTGVPELYVTLDGEPLTYGEDYTVGIAGLQLIATPEAGLSLEIHRDVPFTQEIDFQTGLIDPNQIEQGFDRTVMRDQEIVDDVDSLSARVEEIEDEYVKSDDLATVATTGSYNDLTDKPEVVGQVNSDWNANSGVAQILNKPTLGTAAAASSSDFATAAQGAKADTAVQPGDLATVATSGSYTDLSNTPSIPAAQVNSDWNANSGVAQILNKPSLATVATSGSYNDLSDKPTIQDDIEWATPGTTTYQQIKDWFDNGKTVLANATPDIYYLSKIDASAAHFTRTTGAVIEELWVYTNNVWASAQWTTQLFTNLVTSVSSESTDSQYPSAKLFYDTCGDIESLINAL